MLLKINTHPVKNPMWSYYTPNEFYENDDLAIKHIGTSYMNMVDGYCAMHQISSKRVWREIRVNNQPTSIIHTARDCWWEQKELAERIFWVFHNTTCVEEAGKRYFYYVLEPFEALRVKEVGIEKHGYNPFSNELPALYLPVECGTAAWDETSGGYSDHLRHRDEVKLTDEEKEQEARTNELAEEISKNVQEATEEQFGPIVPGKRI
jgi:hypothetical protein